LEILLENGAYSIRNIFLHYSYSEEIICSHISGLLLKKYNLFKEDILPLF